MSYSKSGVNEEAAAKWVEKISGDYSKGSSPLKERLKSQLGDYAAVFELNSNNWVATACDGVGTKLLWTLAGLGKPEDLAQDLLAMTANDILCVGATPQLFLDYMAIGRSELLKEDGILGDFISSLQQKCFESGQLLVGGETAQLPDLYQGDHFDLAGFGVGFLSPEDYFDINTAKEGDQLWGWTSSGPHSNGYSWLRRSFDSKADANLISKNFMPATKLYVNEFSQLRQALKSASEVNVIRTAYHITGTGYLNLLRKQPKGRKISYQLELGSACSEAVWVKELMKRHPDTDAKEFYRTFNMGVGFCILFSREFVQDNRSLLEDHALIPLGEMRENQSLVVDSLVLDEPSK